MSDDATLINWQYLLGTIQHLEACKVDLYLDQQAIDTTTPMGKLVFQVTGAICGIRALDDQAAGTGGAEKGGCARENAGTT
jgi:hypothetical protein